MKKNKDGIWKNIDRVQEQWVAYKQHIKHVIKPGIEGAKGQGIGEQIHKWSAYLEEFYDFNSRLMFYTAVPRWILGGFGLYGLWTLLS